MTTTPSDYIDDACKNLNVDRAWAFAKPLSHAFAQTMARRNIIRKARQYAHEDGVHIMDKAWARASGMSDSALSACAVDPKYRIARTVSIAPLIETAANLCGVRVAALGESTRHPDVVKCRMLIVVAARLNTDLSYPEIARAIGRPNHSTAITAANRFAALTADGQCPELTEMLDKILALCGSVAEVSA